MEVELDEVDVDDDVEVEDDESDESDSDVLVVVVVVDDESDSASPLAFARIFDRPSDLQSDFESAATAALVIPLATTAIGGDGDGITLLVTRSSSEEFRFAESVGVSVPVRHSKRSSHT